MVIWRSGGLWRPLFGLVWALCWGLGCGWGLGAAPAWAEGNLSLSFQSAADHPVVGEMVEVTLRGVYDRKVANTDLQLTPSEAFDWVQTAPDDWHEEMIDGLPWIVMERKLAIWPRRAGVLSFGPAVQKMTVIDKQSQRQDVVVTAKPLVLSVGEFPALHGWHMAARSVELSDSLSADPARLQDGEVLTRQVKLTVMGVLPEHIPPRPVVDENWLITFAAPVKRELLLTREGPMTEVTWTWQLRPHTGEPGMLEPVKLPYYNTVSRKLDAAVIPAMVIGYASFYTGQVPKGQILAGQKLALLAAGLLGLFGGLGFAAFRLAPDSSRANWRIWRARWSPALWWQRGLAWRRGDLLTLRRIAEAMAAPKKQRDALDHAIYSRTGPADAAVKPD